MKKYEQIPLINLNDFGLALLDRIQIYSGETTRGTIRKRATIITSQLTVKSWNQYLDEPTLAYAIMGRLSDSAHRIEL